MSKEYHRLIGRAFTDKTFRDQLLTDPQTTINEQGFDLTNDELQKLMEDIDEFKTNLAIKQIDLALGDNILAWN
jgi:hypothetical protein